MSGRVACDYLRRSSMEMNVKRIGSEMKQTLLCRQYSAVTSWLLASPIQRERAKMADTTSSAELQAPPSQQVNSSSCGFT
eukprot:6192157-Pleurochrysis_carterae.AAC.3